MFKIYGYATFNAFKVVATANELDIKYDYVEVKLPQGEHLSASHRARHPLGKIPVLQHDGVFIYESAAICRYLAVIKDSPLYGNTPLEKAKVDQLVDLVTLEIGRWFGVYFFEEKVKVDVMGQEPSAVAIEEASNQLAQLLPVIDQMLEVQDYLCGVRFTLADIIAFAYFQIQESTSADTSGFTNIQLWYNRVKDRKAIQSANETIGSFQAR